jgi:hypothetical protein
MKNLMLLLTMISILITTQAFGINFGDSSNYWPGWGNGTGDDNKDVIGIPNFTGGTAELTGNKLTSLIFNQSVTSSSIWGVTSPGDLFINIDADNDWDYFVDLTIGINGNGTNETKWLTAGTTNPDPVAGNYNIYLINLALNSATGYIKSGTDYSNGWSGYQIRDNHPVAYGGNLPANAFGQVGFSGWDNSPASEYIFDFASLNGGGLTLGESFIIGWTVNCANDVIYEKMNVHAPEPATMFLLGSGLIGLGVYTKRKFNKKDSKY